MEFSLSSGRCVGNCYRNGLGKVKFKITTPPVSVTFCGYGFGPRVHRPPREFSLSFGDGRAKLATCVTHACEKEILKLGEWSNRLAFSEKKYTVKLHLLFHVRLSTGKESFSQSPNGCADVVRTNESV